MALPTQDGWSYFDWKFHVPFGAEQNQFFADRQSFQYEKIFHFHDLHFSCNDHILLTTDNVLWPRGQKWSPSGKLNKKQAAAL